MMETIGFVVFLVLFVGIVAFDILLDPFTQGIGIRVLRKLSAGRWPPVKVTWAQRLVGVVVGWGVILSALVLVYLVSKVLAGHGS